ncbi:MAG: hypothetical protein ACJAS9_000867 [Polaribacter sp.]|jgi:hypothetical protein
MNNSNKLKQITTVGIDRAKICVDNKQDKTSLWAQQLKAKQHANIAVVAIANNMARTVFSLLKNKTS